MAATGHNAALSISDWKFTPKPDAPAWVIFVPDSPHPVELHRCGRLEVHSSGTIHNTPGGSGCLTTATLTDNHHPAEPPTLEFALALAILSGDEAAVWAAIDDWQERRQRPEGFVPRAELIDILRAVRWSGREFGGAACPWCEALCRTGTHAPDCRLAKAIGAEMEADR